MRDKEKTISIDKDVHKRIKTLSVAQEIHLKSLVANMTEFYERGLHMCHKLKVENDDLKKQIAVMQAEYVEAWEKIRRLENK